MYNTNSPSLILCISYDLIGSPGLPSTVIRFWGNRQSLFSLWTHSIQACKALVVMQTSKAGISASIIELIATAWIPNKLAVLAKMCFQFPFFYLSFLFSPSNELYLWSLPWTLEIKNAETKQFSSIIHSTAFPPKVYIPFPTRGRERGLYRAGWSTNCNSLLQNISALGHKQCASGTYGLQV